MGDMLSQAEIDALLNGSTLEDSVNNDIGFQKQNDSLSSQEIDALGEIGNISMGTSATTLFTLVGQKVLITTPKVTVTSWEEMSMQYVTPYVAVKVEYVHGLIGSNLLILNENDVKIITDLMMGGDGSSTFDELTDLHLSAISEAMNQMVGSSATSMSSMFNKRIEISPPKASSMHFNSSQPYNEFKPLEKIVKISFKIVIGDLIDSEIMQLLPIEFAKSLVDNLLNIDMGMTSTLQAASSPQESYKEPPTQPQKQQTYHQNIQQNKSDYYQESQHSEPQQQYTPHAQDQQGYGTSEPINMYKEPSRNRGPISIQPAQFQAFDDGRIDIEKKNISIIMDLPLQVAVELGRTNKLIKDILEFGPGSIIELDKLAGEPVDILVNGKSIAKGEVVVIDESFAVRITDIIHPAKRL